MRQYFLIRALWMAGWAGQNMLQNYDSGDNVPSAKALRASGDRVITL